MGTLGCAFLNNRIIPIKDASISILDQSIQFGWGLFETIKVHKSTPILLEEHLDRLLTSASEFRIKTTISKTYLAHSVYKFVNDIDRDKFVLKIILTKGFDDFPGIFFVCRDFTYTTQDYIKGFTGKITSIKRNESSPLVYMKTLNYMENMIAKQDAKESGYDEAIFINTKGFLSEGSLSNLFFIKDNKVYTPKVECGLLPGIIRNNLIKKVIPSLGIEVCEGEYTLDHLLQADEVFLTNSVMEIMPLVKINETVIGKGCRGNVTNTISVLYEKLVY